MLKLLADAERFIATWTDQVEVGIKGLQVDSIPHYSPVVVREILVNAIAHADYEIGGVFSVQIFNNRMEITNPGRWFRGMSEQQLRNGISQPRNRAIVNTLRRLRYVQQSGSAWDKVQAAQQEHGYPVPRWDELGYVIRATIPIHPRADTTTSPAGDDGERHGTASPARARRDRRQDIQTVLAAAAGPMAVGEIAHEIGLKVRQTRIWLSKMEDDGTVAVEGGTSQTDPNRRYRLT
jgi:predicted HTH transcriptional regulator